MRAAIVVALLMLWLLGCKTDATEPTATAVPTLRPATTVPAPTAPPPTMPPTATTLAEGAAVRLATPDPSPNCPEHYPWFFDNPAQECATTLLNTWTVMQPFEHGLMVWFQEGGRTYVLIEDGSLFKPYLEVTDLGASYLPDPSPDLTPPSGFYAPVRGFGKFWRGLVPRTEWVRERLGWATAPEKAYSGLRQCNDSIGDAARCYFTGPQDEIIVMTRGRAQYWNYQQGPVR